MYCKAHGVEIENYTLDVLEAIEKASQKCLPSTNCSKNKRRGIIPGWTEFVAPYASESKFWHSVWLSQGKPPLGYAFEKMKFSKKEYKYAIRRLKKCNDKIQEERFLSGVIGQGKNLFDEIRRYRGRNNSISSRIDEVVGSENIAEHFAGTYSKLYNKVKNGPNLDKVQQAIEKDINHSSKIELSRVDENLIKRALMKLKSNKRDSLHDILSDCYINGPDELATHLKNLIKTYLTHGIVPDVLLTCSLFPLIKNKLGDITSSDNYRAIAGGSLLLKIIDIVILLLEGEKLHFSELQFAYQASTSTTVCSWAVSSVIDTFNRSGSPVYAATMDMSKAFDMVEWSHLFQDLRKRNVNCIFLRLLLHIYRHQKCEVKWAGSKSNEFSVSNGVRQGAVSSAILFAVYIDELLGLLKQSRIGCYINSVFVGAFVFADDILLLSANRSGLQALVNICQQFASERHLKFGTNIDPSKSKTKCIVFSKRKMSPVPAPVKLDGKSLPWVEKISYLGCTLQADNSMRLDIMQKRGQFIGKVNSLLQEFHFISYETMFKLINTYATSFYGSSAWDLTSNNADKLYKSWNVMVRNVLNLDKRTHKFLIEPISDQLHLKTMLMSRLVNFHKGLIKSPKFTIRFLARLAENDHRTVLGNNLTWLLSKCNLENVEELSPRIVKEKVSYIPEDPSNNWKISLAQELFRVRNKDVQIEGFSDLEISEIFHYICTE